MLSFITGYCPGNNKSLLKDLQLLKELQVKTIVCVMTYEELKKYSLTDYPILAQKYGFTFYHVPIAHHKHINNSLLHSIQSFLTHSKQGNVYIHSWKHRRAEQLTAFFQKRIPRYSFLTSSSDSSS